MNSRFGRSIINRKLLDNMSHIIKDIKQLVIHDIKERKKISKLTKFSFYLRNN